MTIIPKGKTVSIKRTLLTGVVAKVALENDGAVVKYLVGYEDEGVAHQKWCEASEVEVVE